MNRWKGENGCHNRKQAERSYQIFIHFAGWWRSTFFALFYFSLPVISKISLCGRTFWHGTTAPTTRRLTTDKRSTKRAANNPASTSCKVTYWPIKTRARVVERHFLALYYNLLHGKVPPFWTLLYDQEEIGIIVALEIGVQLGIKGESERFVVFTRMNLFLEEM